jgi:hypothetical protein
MTKEKEVLKVLLKNYTKIGYKEGIAKVIFDDKFEGIAEDIVKLFPIPVVVVPKGTLYCEKKEWHDWWKNTETEKECSNCGKVEAI